MFSFSYRSIFLSFPPSNLIKFLSSLLLIILFPTFSPCNLPAFPSYKFPSFRPSRSNFPSFQPSHLPPSHHAIFSASNLPSFLSSHLPTIPPTHRLTFPSSHHPTIPPFNLLTFHIFSSPRLPTFQLYSQPYSHHLFISSHFQISRHISIYHPFFF